jgi:hypothetical protein
MVGMISVVAACGGGGGGGGGGGASSAPEAPTGLAVSYGVKAYNFSWNASAGATHYELQEDPDGSAGPSSAADIGSSLAAPGYSHSLTAQLLHRRLNAEYRVRACNAVGCSAYSANLAPDVTRAIGYFKASNTGAGDVFGISVALSADGTTLAVGASNEDSAATGTNGDQNDNAAANSGAVYVFTRGGAYWSQQAYLKASNAGAGDAFGISLALSADGNTLAVGADREDSASTGVGGNQADNAATDSGAVYVFVRNGAAWVQQAYVKASNTASLDTFGFDLALSADGNVLAVSAIEEDSAATGIDGNQADNAATDSGAVYVFARSGGTWSQQAYVKASNTGAADGFGVSLALSADGTMLAVGASGEDSIATGIGGDQTNNSASTSGAVYVFSRSGAGAWSQQAYVKASNSRLGHGFGSSIALSADGSTLAVGAQGESSAATGVNGNQADTSAVSAGAAFVFIRSGVNWIQQAYLKASNSAGSRWFGYSLTLSSDGDTLVVGSYGEASAARGIDGDQSGTGATYSGGAYLYGRQGTQWIQRAYLKSSNSGASDYFSVSLALSGDGNTLAISGYAEDGASLGIGGDQTSESASGAGAVYIY